MKTHPEYQRTNTLDPYVRCAHNDGRGEPCLHPPVVTMEEGDLPHIYLYRAGFEACYLHKPRACDYCDNLIPWWDGRACDWCDRYTDEGG